MSTLMMRRRLMMAMGMEEDEVKEWKDGVPYKMSIIENEYVKLDGTFTTYSGWSRTGYINCFGAKRISYEGASYSSSGYNAFYDSNKNYISGFSISAAIKSDVEVPSNAAYFAVSNKTESLKKTVITPYKE